jgi:hypothetical protein
MRGGVGIVGRYTSAVIPQDQRASRAPEQPGDRPPRRRYAVRGGLLRGIAQTRRVPATGNLGRWLVFPFSVALAWFGVSGIAGAWGPFFEQTTYMQVVSIAMLAMGVWTSVRAPLWGIRLGADYVLVVSWWRSYRVPFEDVFAVRHVTYEGLIVGAGDPIFGERMRMIRLKLQNGDELDLPGTLFRRGNVRRIVQPIKDAMGITHPTRL